MIAFVMSRILSFISIQRNIAHISVEMVPLVLSIGHNLLQFLVLSMEITERKYSGGIMENGNWTSRILE